MKRAIISVILFTTMTLISFAEETFYVPSYYDQSDFLVLTPGASGSAAGAFFNPAVWGVLRGSEMQFFWSDMEKNGNYIKNFTYMIGGKGLGFSHQHWSYGETTGGTTTYHKLDDYNIGMGGGSEALSFGMGYSWSVGPRLIPQMTRDNLLSVGMVSRPCRHASIGLVGQWALNNFDDSRTVLDLGFRPLGSSMLTVFGDAELRSNQNFSDILWAAGVSVEPVPGIALAGKLYQGGKITAGLTYTIGGFSASALPHFDKDRKSTYNTFNVRIGFPKDDIFSPMLMKDKFYLNMKFNNRIKYQRYMFFDRKGYTLTELLQILEDVRTDKRFAGLAIYITEEMSGSPEMIWEVREKMKELRSSGKKIVVFLERGGMMQYYLASVADKIMVDPGGSVALMGFNFGRTYYKNMLEKLGIGFDEWRFFTYKSALESFSRTNMSDADREQRHELAKGFYEAFRSDICESRNLTTDEFDHIVDNVTILSADSLIHYGLADTTGRWDDMSDYIKSIEGSPKVRIGRKALTALKPVDDEWGIKPVIAIIYGLGPTSMNTGLHARRLGPVIKRARENKRIKAVVFRADSPGGDALPADIVAEELKKTAEKKPVIVSQGQVAGSGGYWISMYGDTIVASPWTITGSIGVIGGWLYDDGFYEKLGLSYDHTKVGKHADIAGGARLPLIGAIPYRNLDEEESLMMEKRIRSMYQMFVDKVAEGRDMTSEEVGKIAEGRVWTGTAGKEIGLVDELGGLETAIDIALEAAGIEQDRLYTIVELPKKGPFNPDLFKPKMFGIRLTYPDSELYDLNLEYIRMILQAEGRPLAMMPPDYYPQSWK